MKNFKEIAEKCLAGELSGTFIMRNHTPLHSKYLFRYKIDKDTVYGYELGGIILNEKGENVPHKERVQNFIPDNMKEQIKIDIPEGKIPVMEQTENGVVITWKSKEVTYADVISKLVLNQNAIYEFWSDKIHKGESSKFFKKVEVLRKLTNIRNYFGKPSPGLGHIITQYGVILASTDNNKIPVFAEKDHAEQAIKMLGDELKYLFEPW